MLLKPTHSLEFWKRGLLNFFDSIFIYASDVTMPVMLQCHWCYNTSVPVMLQCQCFLNKKDSLTNSRFLFIWSCWVYFIHYFIVLCEYFNCRELVDSRPATWRPLSIFWSPMSRKLVRQSLYAKKKLGSCSKRILLLLCVCFGSGRTESVPWNWLMPQSEFEKTTFKRALGVFEDIFLCIVSPNF